MAVRLTDRDIEALIAERKSVPADFRSRLVTRPKRGHREAMANVTGADGSRFVVIVRESDFNPFDFSVILGVIVPRSEVVFRLRRYNGRSHVHTNLIERTSFRDFHVHIATERYQQLGRDEESYAEQTSRFQSVQAALDCLFADCTFEFPDDPQGRLSFGRG